MVRRLVEQDEVLLVFQTLGTPSNTAIQKYMNAKKVPQLFVATGATKWNDPAGNPWTMGWQPNYQTETTIYAKHILKEKPNAKIGVLYQNDDYGKDYLKGLKDGLGDKAKSMIVAEVSYEVTDPTVDSQIVQLQGSGADVFVNITTPKFAAQAIRKAFDIGWKPVHYLNNVSTQIGSVLTPAGLDKSVGLISTAYIKDPLDTQWANDPAIVEWTAFMKKHYPDGSLIDNSNVYGYTVAQTLVQVLKQCGDNLTRENVMKQAASLKDFAPNTLAARRQDQHRSEGLRADRVGAADALRRQELGPLRQRDLGRRASKPDKPSGDHIMLVKNLLACASAALALALAAAPAAAQKKYDTGATDTEIKIGNTMPYSGPASAYGTIGKVEAAYFKKINDEGGINGRKINFISPRRRLQPAEDGGDGAPPGRAGRGAARVPAARHAVEHGDPQVHEREEGAAAVRRHRRDQVERPAELSRGRWAGSRTTRPRRRSTPSTSCRPSRTRRSRVLYQNDDYGKDYLKGLKDGLGDKAKTMIVAEVSYETSDPTVDSQIVQLQGSGADVFVNITTPKFAAQAIRKAFDIGWKPVHYLNNVSLSVGSVLTPAGPRQVGRHPVVQLRQGPDRPAVGQRPRDARVARLHEEVLPRRQPHRRVEHLRLLGGAHAGPGAQAVRRQPDPRERHEAGREPEELRHRHWACRGSGSTPGRRTSRRSRRCS